MEWFSAPDYSLARFVLERGLALIYALGFLNALHQFPALLGDRGLLPARDFLREVTRAPHVVVSSTPEYEAAAQMEWLERYADQDFSLTDAVSFAVMADRGIREALAIDHHFVVAGFAVVPSSR